MIDFRFVNIYMMRFFTLLLISSCEYRIPDINILQVTCKLYIIGVDIKKETTRSQGQYGVSPSKVEE